jgi:hypothetical protein
MVIYKGEAVLRLYFFLDKYAVLSSQCGLIAYPIPKNYGSYSETYNSLPIK